MVGIHSTQQLGQALRVITALGGEINLDGLPVANGGDDHGP